MRYPSPLKEGGTLGFCAPSFGCATEPYISRLKSALRYFKKRGFSLELGPNCFAGEGVGISNTPEKCAEELAAMYCSPVNNAVLSVGGGELMCEILDHVDWDRLREAAPKWFMGFSDNTNITFLLPTLCDTAAIYGPLAPAYGCRPLHPSLSDALDLLSGKTDAVHNYESWELQGTETDDPLAGYDCTQPFSPVLYGPGGVKTSSVKMDGRLIGGCMDCLINLIGTPYDRVPEFCERYKDDGIIWFMESYDLNTMDVRRALWQMKHAGWFRHVKGFLFGRPALADGVLCGLEWDDAFLAHTADLGVPVIKDLDIGHTPPMMPLISGGYGMVDATEKKVVIRFEER